MELCDLDWPEGSDSGWSTPSSGPEDQCQIPAPASKASTLESQEDCSGPILETEAGAIPESLDDESAPITTMDARTYQLEMLDESLKRNVIVAMDTGSGKTQVAVLRIKAELEKSSTDKIIWFLAPTVALCEQQLKVLELQISGVPLRTITGSDQVDTWAQAAWTIILERVRVIVSTPQILQDALSHAFMTMDKLALLVIDEAHNCVKNSAGKKMMQQFYHPRKKEGLPVPAVLGLTASPIINSKSQGILELEEALDSACITPTLHRDDLLRCVNRPVLSYRTYDPATPDQTSSMTSLREVIRGINIEKDPTVLRLRQEASERSIYELKGIIMRHNTYIMVQLNKFWARSKEILQELGAWATDHYISKAIFDSLTRIETGDALQGGLINEDKQLLAAYLNQVSCRSPLEEDINPEDISQKVYLLLKELLSANGNIVGIIFVKERATVVILRDLLAKIPAVQAKFRVGTMVGTSNYQGRNKNIYEFNNDIDVQSLRDFRTGKINLLVATTVLEEGIDVPACNLVICFEPPANLKSFIQRRGRARMKESKLVILVDSSSTKVISDWERLEADMKRQLDEEEREKRQLQEVEDEEEGGHDVFVVESTGATLDFDSAKGHLEHICRVVFRGEFVDCRPDYRLNTVEWNGKTAFQATVFLPPFFPPAVRRAQSSRAWRAHKNAKKDAAFQAYVALYHAGLIDEHLLPFRNTHRFEDSGPARVEVESLFNPWVSIAKRWQTKGSRWIYPLILEDSNQRLLGRYQIMLPIEITQPRDISFYPDSETTWTANFGPGRVLSASDAANLPDHTSALIDLVFGHRWKVEDRSHVIKVMSADEDVSSAQIASRPFEPNTEISQEFFIRDKWRCPYLGVGLLPSKPPTESVKRPFYEFDEAPEDVPYLSLEKWTKRADFLHQPDAANEAEALSSKLYAAVYPATMARVDTIPKRFAQFGMLLPSLIHELEVLLIAAELKSTILQSVDIPDMQMVVEAISSRNAREPVDYERLEFLGDSILKYCTVIQTLAEYIDWPEGYLSYKKDMVVSNMRLSRASIDSGLPKFILTKAFTGLKWRPLYADNFLKEVPDAPKILLSTKTIADVVESLIGAAYQSGGLPMAITCIKTFIGNVDWEKASNAREILFSSFPDDVELMPTLKPLEELIGYSFRKKAILIEAVTHASCVTETVQRSLDRLEYLGDAVLDYIVVTKVFNVQVPLPNSRLHLLKTALVNADFLAFVLMNLHLNQPSVDIKDGVVETTEVPQPVSSFLRFESPAIGQEQKMMMERFNLIREDVSAALAYGTHYPWALLARLQARKLFSDLFEALLGAVWVDSGSLEACEALLQRFAVLPCLDRLIRDDVHVLHPREELGILTAGTGVEYENSVAEDSNGEKLFHCKILVGGREIAHVTDGVNKEEVKTKAAEQAVAALNREKEREKESAR